MTYMFILKCALKLVLKNILYYDAWSEKHKKKDLVLVCEGLNEFKYGTNYKKVGQPVTGSLFSAN